MVEDPPVLTIRSAPPPPPTEILSRINAVQTSFLSDALAGGGTMEAAIKPLDPARATVTGPALTCEAGPADNLALMVAVARARRGDVIVAAGGGLSAAILGDNFAAMARNAGVAGLVIDGAVRDVAGIVAVGIPVFARAVMPASCDRTGPGRVGLPVVAGGVAVRTGDIVRADNDGVVVVPLADLDAVLERLTAVETAEAGLQAAIAGGLTTLPSVAALLASDRVRFIE